MAEHMAHVQPGIAWYISTKQAMEGGMMVLILGFFFKLI